MKILELLHAAEEAYQLYGDINIEIAEFSNDGAIGAFWASSCRGTKKSFKIGFHRDLKREVENEN